MNAKTFAFTIYIGFIFLNTASATQECVSSKTNNAGTCGFASTHIHVDGTTGDKEEIDHTNFKRVDNDGNAEPEFEDEDKGLEEEDYTFEFEVPDAYTDIHIECATWASAGECTADPIVMLQECVPSCLALSFMQDFGLLSWVPYLGSDKNCVDTWVEKNEDAPNCESWADDGLCGSPAEKDFLLSRCKGSCMVCIPEGEMGELGMGIGQAVPLELLQETLNVLLNTADYIINTVMDTDNESYHSVRLKCENKDDMCAVYAAEGKCDEESEFYEWMVMNCAPVCQTCELLDFQIRCPIPEDAVDALDNNGGDNGLHALFERIVRERDFSTKQIDGGMESLDYNVEILSRPGGGTGEPTDKVIDGPWVVALDNFLSSEECDKLIEVGQSLGYEPSLETQTLANGNLDEDRVTESRTSTNAWCDDEILENRTTSCMEEEMVKAVRDRIALVTDVSEANSEDLQLLHYEPGQFYKVHHDFIASHAFGPSGPRILTFFLYLNDVEEGGGTNFPVLAPGAAPLTVQPKRGKALVWPSVLDDNVNERDERTEHEALKVIRGVKYGANAWIHLRDEQHIVGIECS